MKFVSCLWDEQGLCTTSWCARETPESKALTPSPFYSSVLVLFGFTWVLGSCFMSTPFPHQFFNPSLKPRAPTAPEALPLSYRPQSYNAYGWTKGFLHISHRNLSVDKATHVPAVSQIPLWKAREPQIDGSPGLPLWGHGYWEPPRCQIQVGS